MCAVVGAHARAAEPRRARRGVRPTGPGAGDDGLFSRLQIESAKLSGHNGLSYNEFTYQTDGPDHSRVLPGRLCGPYERATVRPLETPSGTCETLAQMHCHRAPWSRLAARACKRSRTAAPSRAMLLAGMRLAAHGAHGPPSVFSRVPAVWAWQAPLTSSKRHLREKRRRDGCRRPTRSAPDAPHA